MVQPSFRSTLTVRPGGAPPGRVTAFNRPPSTQQQIEAAKAGITLDPLTGRVLGRVASLEDAAAKRQVRQDQAFSQLIGGSFKQLGLEGPRAEGTNFLRPEQVAALLALRRGDDAPAVLAGIGGDPMPSTGGFSRLAGPAPMGMAADGSFEEAAGDRPRLPILLIAVAVGAFLLLRRS